MSESALTTILDIETERVLADNNFFSFFFSHLKPPAEDLELIDNFPTETGPMERTLYYNIARYLFNCQSDILEIGPFLGGTTRAFALGLLNNKKNKNSRIHTFDIFGKYYTPDALYEFMTREAYGGRFQDIADSIDRSQEYADFHDIFSRLHGCHEYGKLISHFRYGLPDSPDTVDESNPLLKDPEQVFGVIFIDGCKTWFQTKYFLLSVCENVVEDALFILQDYCWYTCFWLSAIFEYLQDCFTFVGGADTTRIFQLRPERAPMFKEKILALPDSYEAISITEFLALYGELTKRSELENDTLKTINGYLHLGVALASIGRKTEALIVLKNNLEKHAVPKYLRGYVNVALDYCSRLP